MSPCAAAMDAIARITEYYPEMAGAIIVVDRNGNHAGAIIFIVLSSSTLSVFILKDTVFCLRCLQPIFQLDADMSNERFPLCDEIMKTIIIVIIIRSLIFFNIITNLSY